MAPDIASRPSPASIAKSELQVVAIRRWLVRVPLKHPIAWASGTRSGVTRLIVELTTAGGIKGYGETICLLDAIPAVLDNVVIPCAVGKSVDQAESIYRVGAGYYHHKGAAVMAICAVEMAMWTVRRWPAASRSIDSGVVRGVIPWRSVPTCWRATATSALPMRRISRSAGIRRSRRSASTNPPTSH
jgi:hypothetical protein